MWTRKILPAAAAVVVLGALAGAVIASNAGAGVQVDGARSATVARGDSVRSGGLSPVVEDRAQGWGVEDVRRECVRLAVHTGVDTGLAGRVVEHNGEVVWDFTDWVCWSDVDGNLWLLDVDAEGSR